MPRPRVTVVVPTLAADEALDECLDSLQRQSWRDFETIVVDNSGRGAVRACRESRSGVRILENGRNLGFGAAINEAYRQSDSEFLATLNDDAAADTGWLSALVAAAEAHPEAGMFASCVRLCEGDRMDSAGMLLCADGSSKQRGHGQSPARFRRTEEALMPSGSAAFYRRSMLVQTGVFDEDFFLYCEDTDLGLRARWAGWKCLYVADAVVWHRYSRSAGRASARKAYYVERNRLFVVAKNFPVSMIALVPPVALWRYFWHAVSLVTGSGKTGEFRREGGGALELAWIVLRAHLELLGCLPRLYRSRRKIRRTARISTGAFSALAARFRISAREVALQ